jgi:hypothetical protein
MTLLERLIDLLTTNKDCTSEDGEVYYGKDSKITYQDDEQISTPYED